MGEDEIIVKTSRRVVKNTSVLIAGTIVSKLCLLALFAVVARQIGVEGFGQYNFTISLASLIIIFGDMGLNTLAIREVAKDRTKINEYLGNVLIIKTIISVIVLAAIFSVSIVLNYPKEVVIVVSLISIAFIFNSLSTALKDVSTLRNLS